MRQHLVHQPHRLHCPQRLIVNTDGAGIVDQRLELLNQQDAHAHLPEVVGDRQAHRTGADNRNLGGVLYGRLNIRIRCCHFQNLTLRTHYQHCRKINAVIC